MVFPSELEPAVEDLNEELSADELQHARLKNDEINRSLGFPPEQDPSDDEILDFDVGKVDDQSIETYFSEEELVNIAKKNERVNMDIQDNQPSALQESYTFVSEVEVVEVDESDNSCLMQVESGAIGVIIPPELHEQLAEGGVNLLLEPVPPQQPGESVSFNIKTVPVPAASASPNAQTPVPPKDCTSSNDTETDSGCSDGEHKGKAMKKKGLGKCHKGGELNSYSLWMRMGVTSDIRLESMSPKDACEKWKAPRRRLRQWLIEYDRGDYANLGSLYTMEELKKRTRLKGGGAKVKDEVLEEKLVTYYNQLRDELYPITTELLAYECLTHDEKFLGGSSSPNFTKRVSDFLRHWRKRNNKRLRKPTSTGQKLPDGYTGKWEACSYYFYLETKGVPTKNVYHGDETKVWVEETPGKVYADAGAKRVPVRTSGQDKDNLTGFLVQNAYGEKLPLYPILRGDTTANRPGMHIKKNNSSIRQRFQEVINRNAGVRQKKEWRNLQFWVNDTSFMDQQSFLHWGRTIWKYRADSSGENQPISVLLLDDLSSHKTKLIMDEFKRLYNTKIIILPGGLTPKAQIMDTHNNRPFKAKVRSMILKLRSEKYKAAKAEAAADPMFKGRVGVPKLSREEIIQIMLDAWESLDPSLGANAWESVKLMPYELAQEKGWTPKEAFSDIRHLDYPWQLVSNIKPSDAGSDVEAIEWDNVPSSHYEGMETPENVLQSLSVQPQTIPESTTESTVYNDTTEPQTEPLTPATTQTQRRKRTSPKSRKPASIFKFLLPPQVPCTMDGCTELTKETTTRCQACGVPGHGNCLHDRILCTTCYNARMEEHKANLKNKRKQAKELKLSAPSESKKPKLVTGLSRSKAAKVSTISNTSKPQATKSVAHKTLPTTLPLATVTFTPKQAGTKSNPKDRAEQRMLQEAIKASLVAEADSLTPVKSDHPTIRTYADVYNPILRAQGRSLADALEPEMLPTSISGDGFGVLCEAEVNLIKEVTDAHKRFMMSSRQSVLIAHLLGEKNISLIDSLVFRSDIRQCKINENFRLFDLMGLLSFGHITDSVLTCYMHYLSAHTSNVYYVNPLLYRWMGDFEKEKVVFEPDWLLNDYIVWPLNLGNWHWVVALFKTEPGSKIYYVDSLNGFDKEAVKRSIPPDLYRIISCLGKCVQPNIVWNSEIDVILVPRQAKKHNDCGACVNEVARAFARDPESFFAGDFDVNFDSLSLRCTQAATLLKWLHHDVCEDAIQS